MGFFKKLKNKRLAKKEGLSYEQYLDFLEMTKTKKCSLEDYRIHLKATDLNMTDEQYMEYIVDFSDLEPTRFLRFHEARSVGMDVKSYEEYLDKYQTIMSAAQYRDYLIIAINDITLEEYIVYLQEYPQSNEFVLEEYIDSKKANEQKMSLSQYREFASQYKETMTVEQYLAFCDARMMGLSLDRFMEYWNTYRTQYTLERFFQYCLAQKECLTLSEYDEWKRDFPELSSHRFRTMLEARNQNMTLEDYEELQEAQKMEVSVEQYREIKYAESLGIFISDLPFYKLCEENQKKGENFAVVSSWEEAKIAQKLKVEKIILNDQTFVTIQDNFFYGFDSIKEIILPWGIKEIGKCAFEECANLRSIIIPGSVKTVPGGIFNGCSKLESIVLSSGIEKVDITGWTDLPSLKSIVSAGDIKDFVVYKTTQKRYIYRANSEFCDSLKVVATDEEQKNAKIVILEKGYSSYSFDASLKDFLHVETLIVDCQFVRSIEIINCPKLKVIMVAGCINHYIDRYKNGNIKNISNYTSRIKISGDFESLEFFIVKDNLEEIQFDEECPKLKWLHIPRETKHIKSVPCSLPAIGTSAISIPDSIKWVYNNPIEKIAENTIPVFVKCKVGGKIKFCYITDSLPQDVYNAEEIDIIGNTSVLSSGLFSGCRMKTLRLPETITVIGENTFAECRRLRTIYFKRLPVFVEKSAFTNCNIMQVHGISSWDVRKVLGIYSTGIENVTDLDFTELKKIIPPGYFSRSGAVEVVIPKRIKRIEARAFADSKKITRIVFLGEPEWIATDAFEGCIEVSEVVWGGCKRFAIAGNIGFPKIKKIMLPNDVLNIPSGCFKNWGIESVWLPPTTLKIESDAFAGCPLGFINDGEEGVIDVKPNWSIKSDSFLGCKIHTVICDCETYETILPLLIAPETRHVIIRDTVPEEVFNIIMSNANLESFSCVTTTDEAIFTRKTRIRNISSNLRRLEIPRSIAEIDFKLLKECSKLEELVIPDTIEVIKNTEEICKMELKKLTVPIDLFQCAIKQHVSKKTNVFTTGEAHPEKYVVVAKGPVAHLPSMRQKDRWLIQKIIIPEKCTSIAEGAFKNLENLISIEINAPIQSIGAKAFYGCSRLEQIILPDSVNRIGASAFEGCLALCKVRLPEILVKLEIRLFAKCFSLKEIDLPDGLQDIDSYAFLGSGVRKLYIPSGIKKLKAGVFRDCTELTEISGMKNVEFVDVDAFAFSGIKKLVFSEEIFVIQDPFRGCARLECLVIPVNIAKFVAVFSGCVMLRDLYMPQQIDEFSCEIEANNSITLHIRRGSAWRQKINVNNVEYLKNADYDELIRRELENVGLCFKIESENLNSSIEKKNSTGKKIEGKITHTRASWNTKSYAKSANESFAYEPATIDDFFLKLQPDTIERDYSIERTAHGKFQKPSIMLENKRNVYVSEETRVITNNIFSILLKHRDDFFPNEMYVSLVDVAGTPVSEIIRVHTIKNQCNLINIQLQLKGGTSNGEYYLVAQSMPDVDGTVICADKCDVDVTFEVDIEFEL